MDTSPQGRWKLCVSGLERSTKVEGVYPSLADPRTPLEPKAVTQPGAGTVRTAHPIGEASEYMHGGAAAPGTGTYNTVSIGVSHVNFMHIYFAKEHFPFVSYYVCAVFGVVEHLQ